MKQAVRTVSSALLVRSVMKQVRMTVSSALLEPATRMKVSLINRHAWVVTQATTQMGMEIPSVLLHLRGSTFQVTERRH